jgi:dolichyl-phosphate-mannose--protein O-mannosyl transferase
MQRWSKHLRFIRLPIAQYWQTHPQLPLWLGGFGIFCVSLLVRFWRLDALDEFVFDEVYYPKFGLDYLQGKPLFDAHPPLGKYIIALGIQLLGYNSFGYRFFNAIAGALIPLVTLCLAYQLMPFCAWPAIVRQSSLPERHREQPEPGLPEVLGNAIDLRPNGSFPTNWTLLAGWFTACDGLLLVESRLGLINIFIVLFGMLSQLCCVLALKQQRWRWWRAIAAGIMLGAACSVKWNGLAYLVGMGAICLIAWLRYGERLRLWRLLLVGAIVMLAAVATYLLTWVPHLQINTSTNLLVLHEQILRFHRDLGVGKSEPVHPYCSAWWSWPLMLRPIAYYYKTNPANDTINYINAMGNPILYWLGAIAILLCSILLLYQLLDRLLNLLDRLGYSVGQNLRVADNLQLYNFPIYIPLYLVASFAGNYLPWSLSRRCIFLYHYIPASVFAFMAIAYVTSWCSAQTIPVLQQVGKTMTIAIGLAFLFWLPIYTGLTIPTWYKDLMLWFPSWV